MSTALPSLRQLRYLVALSQRLNFRLAAEDCFVTQSTLSAGIKELETLLGVELVERDTRTVWLTPIGAEVVPRAAGLLAQARDLVEIAKGAGEPLSGPLRLGVIPTVAPFMLPGLLPPLRAGHPKLQLYLREDLTERLLERLNSAELDMALIALPYDTGELLTRKLFKDEFWFVSRADDPLAQSKEVAVRDVRGSQLLLLEEGHCLREHAMSACGMRSANSESMIEATSLSTLIQMVEGGLGVTLLPEMTLKAGILNGTSLVARPFSTQVPARDIALIARPTSAHRRDFDLLAEFVIARAREAAAIRVPSRRVRSAAR
ncbi:MAG TPA: hydrogen peroxide-inducible genes activator [Burkholderiales bacterium]|nr:hydrogen peroxide-inducible genes activator [Burkholderiales bacterium]